jgi:hypothetical protein
VEAWVIHPLSADFSPNLVEPDQDRITHHRPSGEKPKNMRDLLLTGGPHCDVAGPQAFSHGIQNSRFRAIDIMFINRVIQSSLI